MSEEPFDKERVAGLVADLTVEQIEPVIASAGPNKLAALKEAEETGQGRKGVLEAIAKRQAELDEAETADDDEAADEDAPATELSEEEHATAMRELVEENVSTPNEPAGVEEEPEVLEAPVDEIRPVIRAGDWVTLAASKGVPKHLVNLDAVVERANVRHSEGGDELSPSAYEYQDDSDKFLVRVRNTGETLEVTRAAFSAHGTQQSELGFRS